MDAEHDDVDAGDCDSFLDPMCLIPTSTKDWAVYITMAIVTYSLHQTFSLAGPRCYLHRLYVPALDLSETAPNSTAAINPYLFFDLSLRNILYDRSVSYGDVNLTFSYGRGVAAVAVGNYTVVGFDQGVRKTAQRRDVVETRGVPWGDAVGEILNGSKVAFRLEVAARPRFKYLIWYTKEKEVRIAADVEIDGTGMNSGGDEIRLNLAASNCRIGGLVLLITIVTTSYLLS